MFAQMFGMIRQGMKRNPARITPGRQQRALRPCLTGLEQRLVLDGDASTVAAQIAPPPQQPAVPPANPAAIPAPAAPANNMPQQQQLDILRAQIAASAKDIAAKAAPGPISGQPGPGPNWPQMYSLQTAPDTVQNLSSPAQPPVFPVPADPNNTYNAYQTSRVNPDGTTTTTEITVSYGAGSPTITVYGPPSAPDPISGVVTLRGDTYDANGVLIGNTDMTFLPGPAVPPVGPPVPPVLLEMTQTTYGTPNDAGARTTTTITSALQADGTYIVGTSDRIYTPPDPNNPNAINLSSSYIPPTDPITYDAKGNVVTPPALAPVPPPAVVPPVNP